MRVVPPRQVAVLSIANYDSICSTYGSHAGEQAIASLREFAIRNGVDPGYMRRFGNNTLLLRLDDLPRDKFLSVICSMADQVQDYVVPDYKDARPVVRVGAMSERALRSFVNDAASDLLAYMNHVDCRAAFLAGDELDIWQKLNTTGVELLSHEQLKHIDPFTGLLTIDRFFSLLQEIVEAQESFNTDITVLYLDIDDFKSFNRAFDHDAGDELLLFVANKIAKAFPTDIVAHLTVDRFAVVSDSSDVVRKCAALHEQTRSFREAFAPELKCGAFVLEKEVRSAHIALDCAKLACESIKGRFDVAYRLRSASLPVAMWHAMQKKPCTTTGYERLLSLWYAQARESCADSRLWRAGTTQNVAFSRPLFSFPLLRMPILSTSSTPAWWTRFVII